MSNQIGIIYTTFLRPGLVEKTLPTIKPMSGIESYLFVGDQGIRVNTDQTIINHDVDKPRFVSVMLPFDCGLSAARNKLVEIASTFHCDYCLITADSIAFTPETYAKMDLAIKYMNSEPLVGILGFHIKDRIPWEYNMDIKDGKFILTKAGDLEADGLTGLHIKKCDICRNFFLAKTQALLDVKWDPKFKMGEHEDFFWRFKQSIWQVRWTPDISAEYIAFKDLFYAAYRRGHFREGVEKLKKKYNLTGWVELR